MSREGSQGGEGRPRMKGRVEHNQEHGRQSRPARHKVITCASHGDVRLRISLQMCVPIPLPCPAVTHYCGVIVLALIAGANTFSNIMGVAQFAADPKTRLCWGSAG